MFKRRLNRGEVEFIVWCLQAYDEVVERMREMRKAGLDGYQRRKNPEYQKLVRQAKGLSYQAIADRAEVTIDDVYEVARGGYAQMETSIASHWWRRANGIASA